MGGGDGTALTAVPKAIATGGEEISLIQSHPWDPLHRKQLLLTDSRTMEAKVEALPTGPIAAPSWGSSVESYHPRKEGLWVSRG